MDVCYISNLFRPISKHEQNMITLKKTNSCLLENNGKVLGNDEADVNNQMSQKCKECFYRLTMGFSSKCVNRSDCPTEIPSVTSTPMRFTASMEHRIN